MLVFTDPHITEDSIDELNINFSELLSNKSDTCKPTTCICVGDFYDKKRPSPKEINFGTKVAVTLKQTFKKCIMIRGNHAEIDDVSNVDYLSHLGWEVYDELNYNNWFFGHFHTEKSEHSNNTFGLYKFDRHLSDLPRCLLGHQHNFQELDKDKYHLGSMRYLSFNEDESLSKYYAIITKDNIKFIPLKNTIPIKTVFSLEELDKLDKRYKVRLVIKDFNNFKKWINSLQKYKDKFISFKLKLKFNEEDKQLPEKKNLNELISRWLETIEDTDVKKELEDEFKEDNFN